MTGGLAPTGPALPALPLSPAELAYGMPLGYDEGVPPLERGAELDPVSAMEQVLTRALQRPPCVVSFSGGRDSSALLSLAVRVSRREGYGLPVPATLRIDGSEAANEDEWQDAVLRHLGIEDRVRIDVAGELDVVGPVSTAALRRHGVMAPFNTYFHAPIMQRAAGGSVVTGFGGDELGLSSSTVHAEQVLARRRRPRPKDVAAVGLALAPVPLRSWVRRRRARDQLAEMPWLTTAGRQKVARELGATNGRIPLGWDRILRSTMWQSRYFRVCRHSFDLLGADWDVQVVHPFADAAVLRALAQRGGFAGLGSRTQLVEILFGDALPREVVDRPTKASFDDALWTPNARNFAKSWSGEGLPREYVDPERLRQHWLTPKVHALSASLMQAAWLQDDYISRAPSSPHHC